MSVNLYLYTIYTIFMNVYNNFKICAMRSIQADKFGNYFMHVIMLRIFLPINKNEHLSVS